MVNASWNIHKGVGDGGVWRYTVDIDDYKSNGGMIDFFKQTKSTLGTVMNWEHLRGV